MTALEHMEFTSFWNIWFWGAVVVSWSVTCHFILGVPYDMVLRANREGGEWEVQCDRLAEANIFRITRLFEEYGGAITCLVFFGLAAIGTIAFYLDVESAKALFTLLFPLTLVHGWSVPLAFRLRRVGARGEVLWTALGWRRFWHQVAGLLAILIVSAAAVWQIASGLEPLDSGPF